MVTTRSGRRRTSPKKSSPKKSPKRTSPKKCKKSGKGSIAVSFKSNGKTVKFCASPKRRKPRKDLTEWQLKLRDANKKNSPSFKYKGTEYKRCQKRGSPMAIYTSKSRC